jgi:hypothetical protein
MRSPCPASLDSRQENLGMLADSLIECGATASPSQPQCAYYLLL